MKQGNSFDSQLLRSNGRDETEYDLKKGELSYLELHAGYYIQDYIYKLDEEIL